MLFNTYEFIFFFLPVAVVGYYGAHFYFSRKIAFLWLTVASFFYYSWWNPKYIFLILVSIFFNYIFGYRLSLLRNVKPKIFLAVGITFNLLILFYYKYANFFVDNYNLLIGTQYNIQKIILPLAISFFTFQQISYLVDAYNGKAKSYNFIDYCLFVTFFPQLIAGPIVHHSEMMPQFNKKEGPTFRLNIFIMGFSIFIIGLFKKVMIADTMAAYATPLFNASEISLSDLNFFSAWGGVLAYTFQLYYDFSGYSDMAIGIGLLFGIKLPLNFYSPYKANNIIDFWRRWHMTLSRFLRDYLYIPMGGNRKGRLRKFINLFITMLLGGLWHGAGWTFVVWGALHGVYLIINNIWIIMRTEILGINLESKSIIRMFFSRLITFLCVMIAWVFFRSETFDSALNILKAMLGYNGFILPSRLSIIPNMFGYSISDFTNIGIYFKLDPIFDQWGYPLLLILLIFTMFAPNTRQYMENFKPTITNFTDYSIISSNYSKWRLNLISAILIGFLTVISILGLNKVSEFLYFQF